MKNAIYMLCGADDEIEAWHDQDLLVSFIIADTSGKVVVIDGGHRFNAGHLLKKLKEITGMEKPKVDAWFLTHIHEDHINAFIEIIEKHRDEIEIEKIIHHFNTDLAIQMREGKNSVRSFLDFYSLLPVIGEKIHIATVGENIQIGEMNFEILYTAGEQLKVNSCNNNSLVMKLTLGGKTVMFLADCEVEAGRILLQRYGDSGKLKSDICQMAHHGQCGVERTVYEAIQPHTCLWNTPKYLWNNDLGEGYNTSFFKTIEVQGWMKEIGAQKHYVIKDGDQICEL